MSEIKPKLVIGMPLYNAAKTLQPVLESILSQTYTDFLLYISDNCSSDETEEICKRVAMFDKRVVYTRQAQNIGAEANFDYVLENTDSEYFMWAAADDLRSEDFLHINLSFLDENLSYLGSTSPTRFEDGDFDPVAMGDESRDEDDPFQRVRSYFGAWHANGRYYSIFRRSEIRAWRSASKSFLATDWLFVVTLLRKGKLHRAKSGFVVLGRDGLSNNLNIFSTYRKSWVGWIFPFGEFSLAVLRILQGGPFSIKAAVALELLKLNFHAAKIQLIFERKRKLNKR